MWLSSRVTACSCCGVSHSYFLRCMSSASAGSSRSLSRFALRLGISQYGQSFTQLRVSSILIHPSSHLPQCSSALTVRRGAPRSMTPISSRFSPVSCEWSSNWRGSTLPSALARAFCRLMMFSCRVMLFHSGEFPILCMLVLLSTALALVYMLWLVGYGRCRARARA